MCACVPPRGHVLNGSGQFHAADETAPSRTSHAPVVPDAWETGQWAVRTRRRLIYGLWLVALSLALSVMSLSCRLEAGAVMFPSRLVSAPRRVSKPRPTTTQAA